MAGCQFFQARVPVISLSHFWFYVAREGTRFTFLSSCRFIRCLGFGVLFFSMLAFTSEAARPAARPVAEAVPPWPPRGAVEDHARPATPLLWGEGPAAVASRVPGTSRGEGGRGWWSRDLGISSSGGALCGITIPLATGVVWADAREQSERSRQTKKQGSGDPINSKSKGGGGRRPQAKQ